MLSLLIVLAIIIGGVNIVNYLGIVDDADSVLTLLSQSGGNFPEKPSDVKWQETGPRFQSMELIFEVRFFSAQLDAEGNVISTDIAKIAAVDEEQVSAYAQSVYQKRRDRGFINAYRYLLYDEGDVHRVIFLDCGRMLAGFEAVLFTSTGISIVGFMAVFLLILLSSGRIIRPVCAAYEKQKRFITDAGHELKTPLTIIDADAALLEMDFGKNEWLDDIRTQAKRLSALTNDLICLSRMEETGKTELIELPISDLVFETASSFQALAVTQGKTFNLDIQPMLTCCGNDKGLRQLTGILLDNALKYSSDRGTIRLRLEKRGGHISLTVSNSADCISEEAIASMFDRFYRGDPSRNSSVNGYGIGLSIARAIVNAHRGKIGAEASDGQFSIHVLLPA